MTLGFRRYMNSCVWPLSLSARSFFVQYILLCELPKLSKMYVRLSLPPRSNFSAWNATAKGRDSWNENGLRGLITRRLSSLMLKHEKLREWEIPHKKFACCQKIWYWALKDSLYTKLDNRGFHSSGSSSSVDAVLNLPRMTTPQTCRPSW